MDMRRIAEKALTLGIIAALALVLAPAEALGFNPQRDPPKQGALSPSASPPPIIQSPAAVAKPPAPAAQGKVFPKVNMNRAQGMQKVMVPPPPGGQAGGDVPGPKPGLVGLPKGAEGMGKVLPSPGAGDVMGVSPQPFKPGAGDVMGISPEPFKPGGAGDVMGVSPEPFKPGGGEQGARKLPGRTKFGDITLKRGVISDPPQGVPTPPPPDDKKPAEFAPGPEAFQAQGGMALPGSDKMEPEPDPEGPLQTLPSPGATKGLSFGGGPGPGPQETPTAGK